MLRCCFLSLNTNKNARRKQGKSYQTVRIAASAARRRAVAHCIRSGRRHGTPERQSILRPSRMHAQPVWLGVLLCSRPFFTTHDQAPKDVHRGASNFAPKTFTVRLFFLLFSPTHTHTDTQTRALVLEDFKVIRNKSSTIDGGRLHFHISFTMRFVRPHRWLIPWSLCALTNFPFARHTLLHTHTRTQRPQQFAYEHRN